MPPSSTSSIRRLGEGRHRLYDKKPLILLVSIVMILSLTELYVFLALPIQVVRNSSFSEGIYCWNTGIVSREQIVNISISSVSERYLSKHFRCAFKLSRNGVAWSIYNYLWTKVYQDLSIHPIVESSTLKLSIMVNEMNLGRILNSDAAMIYVGFMTSNGLSKHFLVYAWVLHETNSTKITTDTFKELLSWRIVRLKKIDQNLPKNLLITYKTSILQDLESQDFWVENDWKIMEGLEVGVMLWNIKNSDSSWNLTVYLGCADIKYYWLDNL